MIKNIILLICLPFFCFSQDIDNIFRNKGEVYFYFQYNNKKQLDKLSKIISIDHKTNSDTAFAYANKQEFKKFLEKKIDYTLIKKKIPNYAQKSQGNWDYYPSYDEYVIMMQSFADSFPNICTSKHS